MSASFEISLKPNGEGLLWAFLKISDTKLTGILNLEWERYRKQIVFRRGEPILSKSNWPQETFANFLVRKQVLSAADLQEQMRLKEVEGTGEPLGEFLVRRGFIEGAVMGNLLSEHFQERVFNLLALSHGQMKFDPVDEAKLDSVENMVLGENFKKLLWAHIKQSFAEGICRAKLSGYVTRKGKIKGDCPLPLLPAELRVWNEVTAQFKSVSELKLLELQFFAVASEYHRIDWAESEEERHFSEMKELLEKFRHQKAHEILGVDLQLDVDQCKKVYLGLVKKYHPDRLPPQHSPETKKASEMLFAKINEAYSTLTDPDKRKEYLAAIELESSGGQDKIHAHLEAEMAIPQAKMALRRRHYSNAYELYRGIAEVLTEDGEVMADTAFSEMMMKVEAKVDIKSKLPAYRESFKRALDLKADYADALYYRGVSYKLEGQEDRALQDFDRAIAMNPRLSEAASEARVIRMRKDKKGGGLFGKKS